MTLKIGLTGRIGSGKTTVANVFKKLGVPTFNSDLHAKSLLYNNEVKHEIVKIFGTDILNIKGQIDKAKLAQIIFNDKKKLQFINGLIHPLVMKGFEKWSLSQNSPYVIKESALIFQSNILEKLNNIILVTAPLNLCIQRVLKRDKKSIEEIKKIINNQKPKLKTQNNIDFIINNNESKSLFHQIYNIHKIISMNEVK